MLAIHEDLHKVAFHKEVPHREELHKVAFHKRVPCNAYKEAGYHGVEEEGEPFHEVILGACHNWVVEVAFDVGKVACQLEDKVH